MKIRVDQKIFLNLALCIAIYSWPCFASLDNNINTIQAQGNIGLNFNQPATNNQIAIFIVNSNYAAGFHIQFNFSNKGKFIQGSKEIAITSMVLNKMGSGTLGAGLTEPTNLAITLDGSGNWNWSPGVPTTETVSYLIEIKASWSDPSSQIAGFFLENIQPTIFIGP